MDPKNPDEVDHLLPQTADQQLSGAGKESRKAAQGIAQRKKTVEKMLTKEPEHTPQKMEEQLPRPAESTVPKSDEAAAVWKDRGLTSVPGSTSPHPPETKHEEGSVLVAKHLAPQLGTDPSILGEGRWDERKMAVIKEGTLAALSHFSARYVYDGVRYWGHITEWWLTGSQGIDGRGRRDVLAAIGASTGAQSVEKAKAPNVIARNLWSRNWKEQAAASGKVVEA
jgi:hypothetical protein